MSSDPGPPPSAPSETSRAGAIIARLALAGAVVVACGLLLGTLALPAALAVDGLLEDTRTEVFDVAPVGEADAPPQNSYVYDREGGELAELTFEENRVPVELADIPQTATDAVVATEDADFYAHNGVNHRAIVRAALTNIQSGQIEQGASTITQQYVKDAFLSPEQTFERKIQEAIYAIEVEQRLTKDEILERYLNRSYYGEGVYGIGTAAERYFSKPVEELNLRQSATLAGMLRSPETNNPITDPDNARERRNVVLRQMARQGSVSERQADAASERPLDIEISEPPPPEHPYWVAWISRLLTSEAAAEAAGSTDALEAMGANAEERRRTVFQEGLRIHTTLDPEMQDQAEAAIDQALTYPDEPRREIAREPSGAIVSVEPGTGAIRTMAVGPRSYGACVEDGDWAGSDDDRRLLCDKSKVNPAVPAAGGGGGRQPGSASKPIVDTAALEAGFPPDYTIDARGPEEFSQSECPVEPGEEPYTVNNSGGDGVLDMYEAIEQSSNVYHVELIAELGPERVPPMAAEFGIDIDEAFCSTALGTNSVFPLEMAAAYAAFANRGEYCAPFGIERIESADGELLYEHQTDCQRAVDQDIADRMVDMMAGPVSEGGTAPGAALGAWPTRGKTGTTQNNLDAWFVGYVRQLATAAWIGYPNGGPSFFETARSARDFCERGEIDKIGGVFRCGETRTRYLENATIGGQYYDEVFGATIPAPMWHTYMSEAVQQYEPEEFPEPQPPPSGAVPDLLTADSISEAEEIAEDAGFQLRTETVTDFRAAGTFVGQSPSSGANAPLGSRVAIQVSDGEGSGPSVPDTIGTSVSDAIGTLESAGYDVTVREIDAGGDAVGLVVGQFPGGGATVSSGSLIALDVGAPQASPDDGLSDGFDGDDGSDDDGSDDDGSDDDGSDDSGSDNGNSGNGNSNNSENGSSGNGNSDDGDDG